MLQSQSTNTKATKTVNELCNEPIELPDEGQNDAANRVRRSLLRRSTKQTQTFPSQVVTDFCVSRREGELHYCWSIFSYISIILFKSKS